MEGKYAIIDIKNGDFMKDSNGNIITYENPEKASDVCGIYEFENVWVVKLIYNHIESDSKSSA